MPEPLFCVPVTLYRRIPCDYNREVRAVKRSHCIGEYLVTITSFVSMKMNLLSHCIGEYPVTITVYSLDAETQSSHCIGEYPVTITCGLRFACPVILYRRIPCDYNIVCFQGSPIRYQSCPHCPGTPPLNIPIQQLYENEYA